VIGVTPRANYLIIDRSTTLISVTKVVSVTEVAVLAHFPSSREGRPSAPPQVCLSTAFVSISCWGPGGLVVKHRCFQFEDKGSIPAQSSKKYENCL
jgi:hypothetical protein